MITRVRPKLLFLLVAACLTLLSYSLACAAPPAASEIVFGGDIKVEFDAKGEVTAVYFLDGEEWVLVQPSEKPGVICTCVGTDCDSGEGGLAYNIANMDTGLDITMDCHEIKNAGPRSTGCPLYGSRAYLIGGRVYYR